MSRKKMKRRMCKKTRHAMASHIQAALGKATGAVNAYHPHSLVWGFIIGLSSLTLGLYNPVLAKEGQHAQSKLGDRIITRSDPSGVSGIHRSTRRSTWEGNQHRRTPKLIRVAAQQDSQGLATQPLDIPAGSLQSALKTFSRQFDLQFLYTTELVIDLKTQGVQGTYTSEEALQTLLLDTGLEHRFSDTKTVTLQAMGMQKDGNSQDSNKQSDDDTVIQAAPIVIEETITRSKVFLPPVDGYKADNSTTTTRTALPIDEAPSSIGVVTRDVIRDTLSRSQNDAIEHVSGVARGNRAFGRSEKFNIRGFDIGGAGDFSSIRSNGLATDSLFALDPALIERYEIIKGPASIAGGASSPGGLVNRITKRPEDRNFAITEFQAGSYSLFRGMVDANGVLPQNENVRGRLVFAVEEGGNFVDDVDVRQYTIAPSLEVDLFDGAGTLLLTGHYQKFDGSSYIGFPLLENGDVPDVPRTQNFGGGSDNGAKLTFEGQNYELHYTHEFLNNLTLSVKGKYAHSDLFDKTLYGYNFGSALPANGDSSIYVALREIDVETYAGEVFLSKEFEALGKKHEVLFGVDHRDQNEDFLLGYSYPPLGIDNIFNPKNNFPAPSDDVLRVRAAARNPRTTDLIQTAIFGQMVARPVSRLTMVGAFRYDWASVTNRNTRTNASLHENYRELTGRVGATYELVPGFRVYTGYSQSFQVNVFSTTVNGSLLSPETGENYEVGAKLDLLDGRLRVTTALFRSYRQNVSTTDPANPAFQIAVGEQRHQGVEFDINGQLWPGLNLIGTFSYIDAEITEDNTAANIGSTPTQIPRSYIGSIFATYELQSGMLRGLGFGGGVFFQSGYELELPNKIKTDAYERVDAVVFYRPPQKAYEFTINVRNLLDATYIESPGSIVAYNQFGAPVSVFGTLRVKFDPDLDWALW